MVYDKNVLSHNLLQNIKGDFQFLSQFKRPIKNKLLWGGGNNKIAAQGYISFMDSPVW
jgi:hypothetical protein